MTETGGVYVFANASDAQLFADAHGYAEGPYEEPIFDDPDAIAEMIAAAGGDDGACDCNGPVPGALVGWNDRDEVQRCEDCQRFESDDEAAEAVAAAIGGLAVLVWEDESDTDNDCRYWTVRRNGQTVRLGDYADPIESLPSRWS